MKGRVQGYIVEPAVCSSSNMVIRIERNIVAAAETVGLIG
jgi:hypothetical protein